MSAPEPATIVHSASIASTKRWQRRPYNQILPLLWLAAVIAGILVVPMPLGAFLAIGSFLALMMTALRPLVGRGDIVSTMSQKGRGTLELTPGDIVVHTGSRDERFERAALAGGWLELAHRVSYLVLQMKTGVVVRAAVSRQEGESLLEALGLSHDPRAVALRLGSPQPTELGNVEKRTFETAIIGCAGVVCALLCLVPIIGLANGALLKGPSNEPIFIWLGMDLLSGAGAYYLFKRARARLPPLPTLARIGAEGVLLTRGRRRTWIPFTDLERVECQGGEVQFHLADKRKVSVIAANSGEAQAVVERVLAAQVWATRGSAADRLGRLDRGARTIKEWRSDLELVGPMGAGYRRAGIEGGDLAQVVEDGAAPAERRLAAAIAIASNQDETLRKRVRIAAEASANDRLRVALIKAVEGEIDDEAVEEALDESRQRGRAADSS